MKAIINLFLVPILLIVPFVVKSQSSTTTIFEVVNLPKSAGYDKNKLNFEISKARSYKEVNKIINAIPTLKNISILLRSIGKDGENIWWPIHSQKVGSGPVNWIVQQSKFSANTNLENLNDIRALFTDTLVILDSLKLKFLVKGGHFDNNGFYFIAHFLSADTPAKINLAADPNGYVVIDRRINRNLKYINVHLLNSKTGDRILCNSYLCFLDVEDLEILHSMVTYVKEKYPDVDEKTITQYVSPYIQKEYGRIPFTSLSRFVSNTLQSKSDE